jgi:hypothetical protein
MGNKKNTKISVLLMVTPKRVYMNFLARTTDILPTLQRWNADTSTFAYQRPAKQRRSITY